MIQRALPLLLGSSSPRRREYFRQMGIFHESCAPAIDESVGSREAPDDYVRRMAKTKAQAVFAQAKREERAFSGIVTADTIVVHDRMILGKPRDDTHAVQMLTTLCGATHQVISAYCVLVPEVTCSVQSVATDVEFRSATEDEIAGYVATGEGRDKAGAYAIQGIGAFLVRSIRGSYTNVVGLPLCEVVQSLKDFNLLDRYP